MSNIISTLVVAFFTFAFVLGSSFERLKPIVTITTMIISVMIIVQFFGDYASPTENDAGAIFFAFLIAVTAVCISQEFSWDFLFRLVIVVIPLSFMSLFTNHVYIFLLSSSALLFFFLVVSARQGNKFFLLLSKTIMPLIFLLILFSVFITIGHSNEYVGASFISYEIAALMGFVTLIVAFLTLLLLNVDSMNVREPHVSAFLVLIAPILGLKMILFAQIIFFQFNVELQEIIYENGKWAILVILLILGLASHQRSKIFYFGVTCFLSCGVIAFGTIFVQPSGEAVLPLFVLLFTSTVISYKISQDTYRNDESDDSLKLLRIMLIPFVSLMSSLFILIRMTLSDGLEIVALAILVNFALVIASGLKIYFASIQSLENSLANIILPIRTIFLFSCTLLSTCLLVIF